MDKLQDSYTLTNGIEIPCIGFGTWQMPNDSSGIDAVKTAITAGYRHIDTASIYANEESVGKGVRECGLARDDIFVTSKVWNNERGYDNTLKAFDASLKRLGFDYLDLYLIHWPAPFKDNSIKDSQEINLRTWRALETLYKEGRVKSIGVSNFLVRHLTPLMDAAEIKPMVNQIEFHPGFMQKDTLDFCKDKGIQVEAWSPLGAGKLIENDILARLAHKYSRTVAQICLRWCLQHSTLPLPKTVNENRIHENADIFDFEISEGDMDIIDAMAYSGGSGFNPDEVEF